LFSFDTLQSVVPDPGTYIIEKRIKSYASRIFFIEDRGQKFCVKMWRERNTLLYQTTDPLLRAMYLLDGFYFNSQHAPGVYIGIAPIQLVLKNGENEDNASALTLLPVLTMPQKNDLMHDQEYALVMKRLEDEWQLSKLLPGKLANPRGMEVLARQIFLMHQRLSMEAHDLARACAIGNVDHLSKKLLLNINLFLKALKFVALTKAEKARYKYITYSISCAFKKWRHDFVQREKGQHIRRCHGDLKATNLWLCPQEKDAVDLLRHETSLLALDCIDFMPEFCYIDTLSDVAMLAVDIELYAMNTPERNAGEFSGEALATYFLESYLKQVQEWHPNVWRLLKYYMVEKAMIGTYGSVLNDEQKEVGKQYLYLAYRHAMDLQHLLREL